MKDIDLKIVFRLKEIEGIQAGFFPFPRSLTVYPSEICNLDCPGCNSKGIHKRNGFMDFDLFQGIVEDFALNGGKAVAFEGGGEPMMHPQIGAMLGCCKFFQLKTGIITNGTFYWPEMLLADWIRISIPNANKVDNRVLDNLMKLRTNRITTKIGVKLLRSKLCPQPDFSLLYTDYIQIKDLRNHKDSLRDNPDFVEPCGFTPLRAVVDYDGTFYPCPYFYAQKNTSIGKGLLSELWSSEAHKEAIKNIKNCNEYDCPMQDIDWAGLKKADLDFI